MHECEQPGCPSKASVQVRLGDYGLVHWNGLRCNEGKVSKGQRPFHVDYLTEHLKFGVDQGVRLCAHHYTQFIQWRREEEKLPALTMNEKWAEFRRMAEEGDRLRAESPAPIMGEAPADASMAWEDFKESLKKILPGLREVTSANGVFLRRGHDLGVAGRPHDGSCVQIWTSQGLRGEWEPVCDLKEALRRLTSIWGVSEQEGEGDISVEEFGARVLALVPHSYKMTDRAWGIADLGYVCIQHRIGVDVWSTRTSVPGKYLHLATRKAALSALEAVWK